MKRIGRTLLTGIGSERVEVGASFDDGQRIILSVSSSGKWSLNLGTGTQLASGQLFPVRGAGHLDPATPSGIEPTHGGGRASARS